MQVSFAARGVLNKLNEKFTNMNFLFAEFYDFNRGLDPYFKRRLSQTPMEHRGKDWISIMWSRDPQQQSYNNRQFQLSLNVTDLYAEVTDVRYVFCNIIFTYISNSMSYLEKCERQFFKYVPDGFSVMADDTPYKEWNASQTINQGLIRQARRYNGYVYKCKQAGTTGMQEPTWSAHEDVVDGSVVWTPVKPNQFKVQFENVAYSGIEKFDLDKEDSLCKLEVGGRMFFPITLTDFDDEGYLDPNDSLYPRILYPKDDISVTMDKPPYYDEYVTPTPEYWRKKLGK